MFVLPANHETGNILQKDERYAAAITELHEMCAFLGGFGKQDAVVADDPDRIAIKMGEAAYQGRTIERFEFLEFGTIDQPSNHFPNVIRKAEFPGDDSV